jgi:subfamily B ATP-binding cassette protein MsbA
LKNVSFAYKDNLVLKNINLAVQKNQFIALVGPSGGGKTTLIDLILGLYQPVSGEIFYDNNPLTYYNQHDFCKCVGLVSQDIFLFNDTIASNISYGDTNADMERVKEAAKIAYADEFIIKCSEGYETLLGDRGIRVSGGQRQRIALARAIYHQPELLILDEATSALDSESEKYIQKALKKMHGQLTIIAVAHRLSTIREADVIYYIENCVIKEEGTHDMLMKNGTHYKKLKLMQVV